MTISAPCFLVKGSGETDLPVVQIVYGLDEARHAVLSLMYSDPAEADDTETLFAEFEDDLADSKYWTIGFEIGGISVENISFDAAPPSIVDSGLTDTLRLLEQVADIYEAQQNGYDLGEMKTKVSEIRTYLTAILQAAKDKP